MTISLLFWHVLLPLNSKWPWVVQKTHFNVFTAVNEIQVNEICKSLLSLFTFYMFHCFTNWGCEINFHYIKTTGFLSLQGSVKSWAPFTRSMIKIFSLWAVWPSGTSRREGYRGFPDEAKGGKVLASGLHSGSLPWFHISAAVLETAGSPPVLALFVRRCLGGDGEILVSG